MEKFDGPRPSNSPGLHEPPDGANAHVLAIKVAVLHSEQVGHISLPPSNRVGVDVGEAFAPSFPLNDQNLLFAKTEVKRYLYEMKRRDFHGLSASGIFYRDRDEWMRYALSRLDLNRATRMVGCAIVLRMTPKNRNAWPQQTTIAKELGFEVPTVKLAVRQLVQAKLLSVEKRTPVGGRKAVNHYSMIHPADWGE